jgi:hypothetical protein
LNHLQRNTTIFITCAGLVALLISLACIEQAFLAWKPSLPSLNKQATAVAYMSGRFKLGTHMNHEAAL